MINAAALNWAVAFLVHTKNNKNKQVFKVIPYYVKLVLHLSELTFANIPPYSMIWELKKQEVEYGRQDEKVC